MLLTSYSKPVSTVAALMEAAEAARRELVDNKEAPVSRIWFRGQPGPTTQDAENHLVTELSGRQVLKLLPSLYREPDRKQNWEKTLTGHFQHRAIGRLDHPPDFDEYHRWLCLMQHHGLPTRLLDWSESVLASAYFAVEDGRKDAYPGAAVWALQCDVLNDCQELRGVIGIEEEECHSLLEAAFLRPAQAAKLGNCERILAAGPPQFYPRMTLQHSVFTIHGIDKPLENLADELRPKTTDNRGFLRCIVIGDSKRLREDLEDAGIRRSTLFPDLDSLAKDIVEMARRTNRTTP